MAEDKGALLIERQGAIGLVVINRPAKRNALTMAMRGALREAIETLDADAEARVIVVRGAGDEAFCAGGDIGGFLEADGKELQRLHEDIAAPARCGKPVIAAVRGFCFGAGFEFALACDFIIATEESEFALPEIKLGMIPGSGGTQRLVHRIGIARAKDIIMQGRRVKAGEAEKLGLITCAIPAEQWEDCVRETAEKLAEYSPLALRASKRVINQAEENHLAAGLKLEGTIYGLLRHSQDFEEGVKAYLEKRPPEFRGE